VARNSIHIASCHQKLGEINQAIVFLERAILAATEIGSKPLLQEANLILANCYIAKGDFRMEYRYRKIHDSMKYSVILEENQRQFELIQLRSSIEQKDSEIELLNKQSQIENAEKQTLRIGVLLSFLILILLLVFWWRGKRKNKILANQNLEIRSKNNEINEKNIALQASEEELI
ncbi:MAG: putative membrane protein, partial [Bacteroidia bacterium]